MPFFKGVIRRKCLWKIAFLLLLVSVGGIVLNSCSKDMPMEMEPEKNEKKTEEDTDNKKKVTPEEQPGEENSTDNGSGDNTPSQGEPTAKVYTLAELEAMTYELPVVFHVLSPVSSDLNEKFTTERLQNLLNKVNDLYAGKSGGADVKVRFVLAQETPQGERLPEPGIVRATIDRQKLSYMSVRLDPEDGIFHKQSWDLRRYINLFVFPFLEKGISGVSTYPDMPEGHPVKGLYTYYPSNLTTHNSCVALSVSIFGDWTKDSGKQPDNKNAAYVTAHELGHYLGLYHPFLYGEDQEDFCPDTKEYDRDAYKSNFEELRQKVYHEIYVEGVAREVAYPKLLMRKPLDGSPAFLSDNIMDYYETLGNRFTPDQARRMRECLYYSPTLPGPKILVDPVGSTRTVSPDGRPYRTKCVVCEFPDLYAK